MKATKNIFERKEKKHVVTKRQMAAFLEYVANFIEPDEYFESNIHSTYYDTEDYRVVEHSLTHPKFKEKLRLRSYGTDTVFVELKKKYDGIVYKRRIEMDPSACESWFYGNSYLDAVSENGLEDNRDLDFISKQISREIDVYRKRLPDLSPAIDIFAHRFSYIEKGKSEGVRVTFDVDVWYEDLRSDSDKKHLIDDIVMEIKAPNVYPLWLVDALSSIGIYPQTFTKYGTAYKMIIAEKSGGSIGGIAPKASELRLKGQ